MALKNILAFTAILTLIAVGAFYIAYTTIVTDAANPGNLPALTSSSSIIGLLGAGVTPHVLFEPVRNCSARIISTGFHNIMLAFEADNDTTNNGVSSTTLTLEVGHWQSASTTEKYPAENFGCGWVTGIVGDTTNVVDLASSSISVLEAF